MQQLLSVVCTDGSLDIGKAVSCQALSEFTFEPGHQSRPPIRHASVQLHQRGSCAQPEIRPRLDVVKGHQELALLSSWTKGPCPFSSMQQSCSSCLVW